MAKQTIKVKHNVEVAHRLSLMQGNKCQQIHGHSMWITMALTGEVDESGILLGFDFGSVKQTFRHHLDTMYDHRLLLNEKDPWSLTDLPGLNCCPGDPTTENLARWIGEWAMDEYGVIGLRHIKIEVWETGVNSAEWEADVHPGWETEVR